MLGWMTTTAQIADAVARALAEDLGDGDVTTLATVPAQARASGLITQKAPGVLFGLDVAGETFRALDPDAQVVALVDEGGWRESGEVMRIEGRARALLSAERTALNFLQRLSGVATMAARAVQAVDGTGARILDTRKTTPGLRALEKAAVAAGGATNHRAGLSDAILIKENHATIAGGVGAAVRLARERAPRADDRGRMPDAGRGRRGAGGQSPDDPARQHDARSVARSRRARRRTREARGQRRRHAADAEGGRVDRRRLHLGRCDHPQRTGAGSVSHPHAADMNLPMLGAVDAPLMLENIPALQEEVRAMAARRGAVILAHNYQLPEIQDVADYVGDSLGLSQQAAAAEADTIVFCGVHFMAETASVLCPDKLVLIPDPDAGCSLADSITAEQLRDWKATHPGAIVVMYVNTTAEVKALTDYCCTSANAVAVVEHIYREHGDDAEILFGPDMFLGAYVEKTLGRRMHVWDGECHVHAGIKPADITAVRAAHPDAEFLIHPECGCSTSVMEYVAAGDVAADGVRMLSTGGMLAYARERESASGAAIVATETGMLHPLRQAAPGIDFIAANEAAHCRFMKMITLPKLLASLTDRVHEVKVPARTADRARVAIERMVSIS